MAEVFVVGTGAVGGTEHNVIQLSYESGAVSLITGITVGGGKHVAGIEKDLDGNYYIAVVTTVYKYDSNFSPVTSWGVNGRVVITASADFYPGPKPIAVNDKKELAVVGRQPGSDNVYLFDADGNEKWRTTYPDSGVPLVAALDIYRNIVVSAEGTIVKFSYNDGSVLATYDPTDSDDISGLAVTTSNQILAGGIGGNADLFEGTSPAWTNDIGRMIMDILPLNSSYSFWSGAEGDTTAVMMVKKLDSSNGTVLAEAIITGSDYMFGLAVTSNNNIIAVGNGYTAVSANIWVFDSSSATTTLNQLATAFITTTSHVRCVVAQTKIVLGDIELNDSTYSKHLVAIAGNKVFWEPSTGTLSEITAARNEVVTSNPLSAFSGYQKVFVANVSSLKILDFANIKLATSEIGAAGVSAPQRSITLTGSASGAKMLTDFCTAATGSAEVYGYLTHGSAFVSGDVVTGGPNNTVSFTLITASTTAPHCYDWTPQHNDTTNYGSMPSKAKYGCIYRGRAVLAGNPDYPHQWYMSDVADVFRWDYRSNNPLSAIRGGNADAGQIGDIIKALIPLGDDYLIFGCANSIWQLSGDPAAGGSLNPVTEDTGIFGPKAWCLDDQKNLYFFGRNGLYKASIANGMSIPVNISQLNLPNWIDDWALDDSTHRIVLSFDPVRRGIIISKTNLADGINENYWFDLKTNGFFKEEYPPHNGIFCSHFYNSTEPDYRGLLLGCKDGYIRYFNDSAKDDDVGTSSAVITSYVLLPVLQAGDLDKEGKLNSLTVELAGGASSGVFGDTDCLDMFIYTADDAETLLEDVKDGASAIVSVHLTGTGRKSKLRYKISGHCIGIKLQNSTSNSTWAINRIYGNIIEGGNIKG